MNIERLLRPQTLIAGISIVGVLLLAVLCWFRITESRARACRILDCAQTHIFILIASSILLLFASLYIPVPALGAVRSGSTARSEARQQQIPGDQESSAQDFYRESFANLLTVFGVIGTLFGVIVPFAGYLLQRNSLKEEAANIRRDYYLREKGYNQKQRTMAQALGLMKNDIKEAQRYCEELRGRRDFIVRAQLDGIRANLEAYCVIFSVPGVSKDWKSRLFKMYLSLFVDFLRSAVTIPSAKPFTADIGRFNDAMKMFRKEKGIYDAVMDDFAQGMKGDMDSVLPGLCKAFSENECEIIRHELGNAFLNE